MSAVIEVRDLAIRYGKKMVLEAASLRVEKGSVYALLGRNGSGKSSLIRAILGMQRPAEGSCFLFGEDVWRGRARLLERVGFVAEEEDVEREMTVGQLVDFHRGMNRKWSAGPVERRLEALRAGRKTRFGSMSKGERRQISLALALGSEPELLVLDDPTLGLDAVARKELYGELLGELADRNTTTFITTHDLAAIEGVADRVGIVGGGRLILDEQVETLKSRFRRIRRSEDVVVPGAYGVVHSQRWGKWVEEVVSEFPAEVSSEAVEAVPMSLEEIFIAVTGGQGVNE